MKHSLNKKFIIGVILIIVPILGLIFTWIAANLIKQAKAQTLEKARVVADTIILTRQWVTDCDGGVFVPVQSLGAINIDDKIQCRFNTPIGAIQMLFPCIEPRGALNVIPAQIRALSKLLFQVS